MDFPENLEGIKRGCVLYSWSDDHAYGNCGNHYFPASWVTEINAQQWTGDKSTDGSEYGFNQMTARALEYYEFKGNEWVPTCTCRKYHYFNGGYKALEKHDCYYYPNMWTCSFEKAGMCDWLD